MMSNIERSVVKRTITRLWKFEPSDCLPVYHLQSQIVSGNLIY